MADKITSSGASDPYSVGSYSAGSNSKNTLTIESYFKLLAAQLANQDMTSPMDNSEMMAQMTQMAMVQSLTAMTDSVQTSTAVSMQTYAASMVGQEITVAIVDRLLPWILPREHRLSSWKGTIRSTPCPMSWEWAR